MPVTAKLSRRFYDAIGADVANDLVTWFNEVDATYRADLKELNEANFIRSDSRLEQRFAEFELRIDRRFAGFEAAANLRFSELEARIEQRFAALEARITDLDFRTTRRFAELELRMETGFERLRGEMIGFKADLIKWMFLFWLGTVATTLAIIQAVR